MPRVPFLHRREMIFELVVIEGRDCGRHFDVQGRDVPIGRDATADGGRYGVVLSDPTVSAHQAVIHLTRGGPILEHQPGATNPTLVNGRPIARQRLASGDRIQMGVVALEFRGHTGEDRGGAGEVHTESRPTVIYQPTAEDSGERRLVEARDVNEALREGRSWGRLLLAGGSLEPEGREFQLRGEDVSIGRSPDCNVSIPEPSVSRLHARLVWRGGRLLIEHCSRTNATYLNGRPVPEWAELPEDAEIQLADEVVLRLELLGWQPTEEIPADRLRTQARSGEPPTPAAGDVTPPPTVAPAEKTGLLTALHAQIEHEQGLRSQLEESQSQREEEIDRKFGFTGTFLDVDVVDSYGMKARASRSDYIIISFERFRKFVRGLIDEFDGEFLNSNGDELMCFFESPLQAVRAASAVVARLEAFNREDNLLASPFRVRQGAHTGHSLVDRKRGVAYSPILDVAGHLQKDAETNGLLISQQTLEALPEGVPFERVGELKREGIPTHRLVTWID